MKLTQFIILGLCLAILTSTAGATEIYFGHMATRVIVEHDGVEKNFQDIITFNLLSAPAYRGCGNNECITGYTGISADGNENVDFMNLEPICTAIQHFNEKGELYDAVLKTRDPLDESVFQGEKPYDNYTDGGQPTRSD